MPHTAPGHAARIAILALAAVVAFAAAVLGLGVIAEQASARAGGPRADILERREAAESRQAKLRRARRAPVLKVSGGSLAWRRVRGVRRYVVATIQPGRSRASRVVRGTRFTPPAVPGATVRYRVRTKVARSAWARTVSIAYPGAPGLAAGQSGQPGTTSTAPATAGAGMAVPVPPTQEPREDPGEEPPPSDSEPGGVAPGQLEIGLASGSDRITDAAIADRLGARVVRVEFGIGRPVTELRPVIAAHADHGTRVVPLASFNNRVPTIDEARNLATWAREFGPGGPFWAGRTDGHLAMRQIEFGNETSYRHQIGLTAPDWYNDPRWHERARTYALRLRDAHVAIRAVNTGVGLLAQADDGNTGSSLWVDNMFAAVPDLASRVTGWTIHPYGPWTSWKPRIDRMLAQVHRRGAPSNIGVWVTEWGVSTDAGRCLSHNYGWNTCMSYASAGTALTQTTTAMRAAYPGRLRGLLYFQVRDQKPAGSTSDREAYFGAVTVDQRDKGAFTDAVRAALASAP